MKQWKKEALKTWLLINAMCGGLVLGDLIWRKIMPILGIYGPMLLFVILLELLFAGVAIMANYKPQEDDEL